MRSITLSIKFNVPVGCRWFWPSGYPPDWLRDGALSPRVAGADQWHAALHHVRASPNAPWLSGCERCLWEITQRDWMKSRQRFSRAINGDGDIEPKCIIQHLKAKAHFALSSLCCAPFRLDISHSRWQTWKAHTYLQMLCTADGPEQQRVWRSPCCVVWKGCLAALETFLSRYTSVCPK